jgi:transposase
MKHKKEEIDENTLTNFFNLLNKKEEKTYKQAWPAYDEAKTNEDIMFKRLLGELLYLAISEPVEIKRGRKGYSISDKLFCMAIKVYYKGDLRKTVSILKEMKNLHHIDKVPCFKSIDNFFNDESLNSVLDDLILISSLPLANMEETGAVDSTGFGSHRYSEWNEHKYRVRNDKEHAWRKLHACVGCKTNIFISTEVSESSVHELRVFEKIVGDEVKLFSMKNFVADKGYSARFVMTFIEELGLVPYIPFKKRSTGRPGGSLAWARAFKAFMIDREQYMKKYHVRSNVESNFHMLKTRFGSFCSTRLFKANSNEIKTKVLCHNLCILIQELYENDINIDIQDCVRKASTV